MDELPKAYDPKGVEDKWYQTWLTNNCFAADAASKKSAYSIVIPPPNVTGVLTIGHVLNNTIQDILVRRKRMQGHEVLWLPGTDHAGIATQTVVERELKKEGRHRDDLGREGFLKRVWEWRDRHGGIIIQQLKRLGCSCDWTREVFTMDGLDERQRNPRINYSLCVQRAFIDLYEKGLIYRGKRMVNWCPVSRTALSDEEVVMRETDGHLWYIRYPLEENPKSEIRNPRLPSPSRLRLGGQAKQIPNSKFQIPNYIVVATTRPETMLGDEAVAVNPKDKRYRHLIGKKVLLPLANKLIPIIADSVVEMGFGTGAVKVTPAHDPADYEIALRHKLPFTMVIGPDGAMTDEAPEAYSGLDRFEAREKVVADLEELGLIEKIEPYRHSVGYSQRADVPIEPMPSEQWFLKYPQVKRAIKAVTSGEIRFWPRRWIKVYTHWMHNIRDWCISRQLWWGHRIPAWYCQAGIRKSKIKNQKSKMACPPIVSIERPTKCPRCGSPDLVQDPDVLDTWFSSWLWPFATMGWPEQTADLKKFYPTADLVTGPDIIFFWVARMIMAGYEFVGKRPFRNVYFTGIIRDAQGRKISKSLGNSPEPLDLISRYGADGLRFGIMLIAPQGQDILFSEDRIEVGRNFMNKLWNAARFVMMNVEEVPKCVSAYVPGSKDLRTYAPTHLSTSLSLADKWIINRLQHAIREVNKALDNYQFDGAARVLYQFVWGEFCDWYLEMAKSAVSGQQLDVIPPFPPLEKGGERESHTNTIGVLIYILDHILRLLHPFAPFITEEIWQKLATSDACPPAVWREPRLPASASVAGATIMFADYPVPPKKIEFAKEAHQLQTIMDIISAIRNIRGEHNVQPGKRISAILITHDKPTLRLIEETKKYIIDLARLSELTLEGAPPTKVATAIAGKVEIFVPFAGMIDIAAERERLAKEIARLEKYVQSVGQKLANKDFIERAPKEVVEKERARLKEAVSEREKLRKALVELE